MWVVGVTTSPPIEAAAFAALAVSALLRWPTFVARLRERPALRTAVLFYLATVGWACASSLWRPEGVTASLYLRLMLAPLLIVHAPLSMRTLRWVACVAGVAWTAVLLALHFGVPIPEALVPNHVSKTLAALMLLGAFAGAGVIRWEGWRRLCASAALLAAWFVGSALAASRARVGAILIAVCVCAMASRRTVKGAVITSLMLVLTIGAAWVAMSNTPLAAKIQSYSSLLPSDLSGALSADGVQSIDAFLSRRLTLWDWTVHHIEHPLIGSGAGSWPVAFDASIGAGNATTSWGTAIPRNYTHVHNAHSLPLQLWFEQGAVGVTLFLGFLASYLVWAWRARGGEAGLTGLVLLVAFTTQCPAGGVLLSRASAGLLACLVALMSVNAAAPEPGRA